MARTPADQKDGKIVPVGVRFRPHCGGDTPVAATPSPVPLPAAGIAAFGVLGIGALLRRRRNSKARPGAALRRSGGPHQGAPKNMVDYAVAGLPARGVEQLSTKPSANSGMHQPIPETKKAANFAAFL